MTDGPAVTGRVALVTGGGRGIGAAIARALAGAGHGVFLVSRTAGELEAVASEIAAAGGTAAWREADVADAAAVTGAVERCVAELGEVDVLVNAAAVHGPIGPAWEVDADAWARAVAVNLMGTLNACRAVIPAMVARRAGRILNFSGGGATAPMPRFTAYAASKAAVVRLTETLAEELRPHGVAVNAIAPGVVDTRLQDGVLAAGDAAGAEHQRMRRLRETGAGGVPVDVPVALALFLASDAAAGLSGKLVSAPHDDWRDWDARRIDRLMATPWLTLRRLDPHTIAPLVEDLSRAR